MLVINIDVDRLSRRIFYFTAGFVFLIFLLDVICVHFVLIDARPLRLFFNPTREDSLGNFYSSLLALAVGCVVWGIFALNRLGGISWKKNRPWLILAIFFIAAGIDDATTFHERVGLSVSKALGGTGDKLVLDGNEIPFYGWHIAYVIPLSIVVLTFLQVIFIELKNRKLMWLALAALGLNVAAVLLDFVEPYLHHQLESIQHFHRVFEEILEMLALCLFLTAFLSYLLRLREKIVLEIK